MKKITIIFSIFLFLTGFSSCTHTLPEWFVDGYIIMGKGADEQFFIADEPVTIRWLTNVISANTVDHYVMTDHTEPFVDDNGNPCNYVTSKSVEFNVTYTKTGDHMVSFYPVFKEGYKSVTQPYHTIIYVYKTAPSVSK